MIAFTSANKVGLVNEDSTGERYLEFPVPGQVRFALGPRFPDGRFIVTSYEDLTISKLVMGNVITHTWIYDLYRGRLEEILQKGRIAPFMYCTAILPGGDRLAINAALDGEECIFTMDLDGGSQVEVTKAGEGYCYGVSLNPGSDRLAFHVTGSKLDKGSQPIWFRPGPYSINTIELDGKDRMLIAGEPGHLYFGPCWSPDGRWLVYLDCHCQEDPAHFWADLCIGRPGEHRVLTGGQSHWFGTTFGAEKNRGGGSNVPRWMPDGEWVTYTRVVPGSHPDCEYHPELPDHTECVYHPELARGGSQVCLLNPFTGQVSEVTAYEEHKWDLRAVPSEDGKRIVFTRARVGHSSELWVSDVDGKNQRLLSRGIEGLGADFGRWLA
jgi:Tol biopolymer transport system component